MVLVNFWSDHNDWLFRMIWRLWWCRCTPRASRAADTLPDATELHRYFQCLCCLCSQEPYTYINDNELAKPCSCLNHEIHVDDKKNLSSNFYQTKNYANNSVHKGSLRSAFITIKVEMWIKSLSCVSWFKWSNEIYLDITQNGIFTRFVLWQS